VTVAAYYAAESIHALVSRARPEQSVAGLAVTAAALVLIPGLAIVKRRNGQALGNHRPHRVVVSDLELLLPGGGIPDPHRLPRRR
jgi:hypothetical protein